MPHFMLLGHPVGHSLSPFMHNRAAEYYGLEVRYHAIDLQGKEINSVAAHFNRETFRGANVTIPYKQVLLDYVDRLDAVAQNFGAINTIVREQGMLVGYNTDVYGFSVPLEKYADELEGGRAIIFGTGGASRAIVYALQEYDMQEIYLISRNPGRGSNLLNDGNVYIESYDAWPALSEEAVLIVNATPLGMEPDVKNSPVRDTEVEFLGGKICYDIVYKPLETRFLKQSESAGARTIGGLEMLIQQGSRSFELWTGQSFPLNEIRSYLYEHIRE